MRLLSISEEGMGISDLAKSLHISKGTIHGITSALEDLGAIRREPSTKRYTLGFTIFELGRRAYSQINVKDSARPVMEDLMERTQSSVFLGVLNREYVTIIDVVESRRDYKITSPIGTTIPILAGAVGKVFLAGMDEARAMSIIGAKGLHGYTEKSITVPGEYFEEIKLVREQGYATDDEEYIPGVWAVASPITGTENLMYAIWAVGFKAGIDAESMKALAEETRKAAMDISRRL